ncbi:MAG TPA: 23S rRNA (adenine(2503)-C(2))-methyltransferase RlmN [Cytophagales bacterium]|nr:23S rRNA (adenine(2503)-C(2))-methyltransferase RlmN [Cytophagales bacterium]
MNAPQQNTKKDIRSVSVEDLATFFLQNGEPKFRAKQVLEWIWVKSATSFDGMTNISLKTRELLSSAFAFYTLSLHKFQKSNDGTLKSAFALHDGNLVEGVLIPHEDRMTACVSSQVGCSLTCKFCATGYMERVRNLQPYEIYDQVVAIHNQAIEHYGTPLTNIVYMGMGEPLLNYANVLKSIDRITAPDGLNMSPKRITLSTAGVAKMIMKLADDGVKFNLALSLHAADDEKRNQIMPINESNTLKALKDALTYFYQNTKNKITLEYILFYNFNDKEEDAQNLIAFAKNLPLKVNIIEYNPISEADFKNTSVDALEKFSAYLKRNGIVVNVRRSRGKDIDAACGQLANKQ